MEHLLTCTTEELALMVSVAGYHGIAKGIAEPVIGNKSEKEWVAVLEATTTQLMMKNMWNQENELRGGSPLTKETTDFIEKYIHSKRMLRCSNAPQKSVLLLHHYQEDDWLLHVIDRDIIHEFALISSSELKETVKEYYGVAFTEYAGEHTFSLTDKAFDALSNPKKIDKVLKKAHFTQQEQESFSLFTEDLQTFEWTLFNISNLKIENLDTEEVFLENIIFFLPSKHGVWIAEYTENPDTPIHIYLANLQEWDAILTGIGEWATYQMQG